MIESLASASVLRSVLVNLRGVPPHAQIQFSEDGFSELKFNLQLHAVRIWLDASHNLRASSYN